MKGKIKEGIMRLVLILWLPFVANYVLGGNNITSIIVAIMWLLIILKRDKMV